MIPVIVQPWQEATWLAKIEARPRGGQALAELDRVAADAALADLVKEIAGLLTKNDRQTDVAKPRAIAGS